MVLEDFNGGRIAAVSYDSREPIARTLSSFAINLNGNPTFAGIVSQMRGERVEVVAHARRGQPAGQAHGRHRRRREAEGARRATTTVDAEVLNMWCAEGLRAVKLPDVQQLRFANPVIESEFRRALDVLALSPRQPEEGGEPALRGRGQAEGAGRLRDRGADLEDELPAGAGREGEAVPAGLGDGREPDRRGLGRREDGADQRAGRSASRWTCTTRCTSTGPTVEPELFASLRPVTYRGGFGKRRRTAGRPVHAALDDAAARGRRCAEAAAAVADSAAAAGSARAAGAGRGEGG